MRDRAQRWSAARVQRCVSRPLTYHVGIEQNVSGSTPDRAAALAGFALFVLIGATGAMYGPTIPAFRSTFHISVATAGLLLSGHFGGSLAGTLSPGFVPRRFRAPRIVAMASTLCFALGCLVIGTAPTWPTALTGAVVEGAGWGGLVIALNTMFASGFGSRSPAMLTLLNALYGVGAILGPAGVGLLAGGTFRAPFLTAAGAGLVLLPLALALPRQEVASAPPATDGKTARHFLLGTAGALVLAFFLYGGLEGGLGAWITTHLIATGLSAPAAATFTSLFWAGYTLGRLLSAPLALRVRPEHLVLLCLTAVSALTLATRLDVLAAAAYSICGFVLAPIFPLALVWSGRVIGGSQRINSFVISGDLLGGVVISALLGQLIARTAAASLAFAFAAIAGATLCILLAIYAGERRGWSLSD